MGNNEPDVESKIVHRVKQMEQYLDEILLMMENCPDFIHKDAAIQEKIQTLKEYYVNGEWLHDFECDERGEFPAELKRGVLAEDTLFNLFSMTDHVESLACLTRK